MMNNLLICYPRPCKLQTKITTRQQPARPCRRKTSTVPTHQRGRAQVERKHGSVKSADQRT